MNCDFIEIGTSNFDTCIQSATDQAVGISVEPVLEYLSQLPDRPFVKKLNCAVSKNNSEELVDVYYIPEEVIQEYGLPWYIKGCNSVGGYHKQHEWLNVTHLVEKRQICAIPISSLFVENGVACCDLLKMDTEGTDCGILLHLVEFLKSQDRAVYPKKIVFESNALTSREKADAAVKACVSIGYAIECYAYLQDTSMLVLS